MSIEFTFSADKHGIEHDRVRYVIEHCQSPLYSNEVDSEDLVTFLGHDQNGVPLEVVAIEASDGGLPVIHAMKLRTKYVQDLARVMGGGR